MEALEFMLDLASGDYAVEESDGQIVASFRDADGNAQILGFAADDPEPEKRAECLDWSVRVAMGDVWREPPAWVKEMFSGSGAPR